MKKIWDFIYLYVILGIKELFTSWAGVFFLLVTLAFFSLGQLYEWSEDQYRDFTVTGTVVAVTGDSDCGFFIFNPCTNPAINLKEVTVTPALGFGEIFYTEWKGYSLVEDQEITLSCPVRILKDGTLRKKLCLIE